MGRRGFDTKGRAAPARRGWQGAATSIWLALALGCADEGAPAADAPADARLVDAAAPPDAHPDGAPSADAVAAPDASTDDAGPPRLTVRPDGLSLADGAGRVHLALRPRALVDGAWVGARLEGDEHTGLVVVWEAPADLPGGAARRVEALALDGGGSLYGARVWLSNGFQSWSNSGVLSLGAGPEGDGFPPEVGALGDLETLRRGDGHSWFYTFVGGGPVSLVAGALSAAQRRPWVQVALGGEGLRVRLVSGAPGDEVLLGAGASARSERWLLAAGEDLTAVLEGYGEALARGARARRASAAGWNSWYELYAAVDEPAVRANAARARALLEPHLPAGAPPLHVVVDDGWQMGWGDWQPNAKFPSGLDGLAADLRADGFVPGVWLAPLLVHEQSELVARHPEWFVGGAVFRHLQEGPMRVLDPTHPEAAAHLTQTIRRLVGWGYGLLKIDFLFAGTWPGLRHRPVTGMTAYEEALRLIREAAGEETALVAVGAPGIAGFAYVDAWRVGPDIAFGGFEPGFPPLAHQARSLAARWPLCRAVTCDADPVLLRLPVRPEVEVGAWIVALSGGGLFLSDDLRALPEERAAWGLDAARVRAALGGVVAVPEPPWPDAPPPTLAGMPADLVRGTVGARPPRSWRLPDGGRVHLDFEARSARHEAAPAR